MPLLSFITQNPPDQDIAAHGTSLTKRKDKKSQRKEQEKRNDDKNGTNNASLTTHQASKVSFETCRSEFLYA